MSLILNFPTRYAVGGDVASTSAAPALETPTVLMESLIIGTGFDIAMVQNGLLPPRDPPPEEHPVEPADLTVEQTPIELAAVVDVSALPFDQTDPIWWFFGYA